MSTALVVASLILDLALGAAALKATKALQEGFKMLRELFDSHDKRLHALEARLP